MYNDDDEEYMSNNNPQKVSRWTIGGIIIFALIGTYMTEVTNIVINLINNYH